MLLRRHHTLSETQKKRSLVKRMVIVHSFLLICVLLLVARLMELQIIDRSEYYAAAQSQHFGGVKLPAQRGEILALNSKTGETTILATNSTLDLLYVDPLSINPSQYPNDDYALVAETLADLLLTEEFHEACAKGEETCPRELISFSDSPYAPVFDPLLLVKRISTGAFLEPLPLALEGEPGRDVEVPDITEARRIFARDIESRISEDRVTFVPVKYGATKIEMKEVEEMSIPGITVNREQKLIFANPEDIAQNRVAATSRRLATALDLDPAVIEYSLRSRPLRYVAIMRRLPPELTLKVKEKKLASVKSANELRSQAYASKDPSTRSNAENILDPLRSIAVIPEHWRYYPDGTIGSQLVGFLNINQEAQYGIERMFDSQLRGQEGLISTVSDPQGGQILTAEQTIIDPKDGDTLVLTIDPFIQKEVERILDEKVKEFKADSAQAIVMDPHTGRILAMVNAPVFERNEYASVYDKVPVKIPPEKALLIVVEIFNPINNARIVKGYVTDVFTPEGREKLPVEVQNELDAVEQMYDLEDLARYYLYYGENARQEVFPTEMPGIWLQFKNNLGVGAYLNRVIQEIYEPGSVMKPITMAIAIDQGEVAPGDIYDDKGPVEVDEYTIKNALLNHYGKVTMTNCLEFSINTCMTSVSQKLGRKLFEKMITRFGFGRVTGIELDDELSGEIPPWRTWSNALLATASFGQGISATPLQVITANAPLANGGKLMKPTIIDRIIHPDGTVDVVEPVIVDQVITKQTSETITAMLVSSTEVGFAKAGKVPGYRIASKTGTSQIAAGARGYEAGTGSTINTFMGYAPVDHPRFIVLVKFDRPKFMYKVFAENTSAPTFKDIAAFLLEYYGIPPDQK